MRIGSASLVTLSLFSVLLPGQARAVPPCGIFRTIVYAPLEGAGKYVQANPKAITKTKLILPKDVPIAEEHVDRLLEIEFRLKSVCYRECEIETPKILRKVSPFERIPPFTYSEKEIVKAEPCENTPSEAFGL